MLSAKYFGLVAFLVIFFHGSILAQSQADPNLAALTKAEANLFVNRSLSVKLLDTVAQTIDHTTPHSVRAYLFNLQAHIDILAGRFTSAYQKAIVAGQEAREGNDELQEAEAIRRQGIVAGLLDLDSEAIALLSKSLTLHRKLNSDYVQHNLQALGNLYAKNDHWAAELIDTGEQLIVEAIQREDVAFQEQGYAFVVSGLVAQNKLVQAEALLNKVVNNYTVPGSTLLYYTALLAFKSEQYDLALARSQEVIEIAQNEGLDYVVMVTQMLYADILLSTGRVEEGKALLEQLQGIFADIELREYEIDVVELLIKVAVNNGNYRQAFAYQQQYIALKNEALLASQAEQLAFNRARMEAEQKSRQIETLTLKQATIEQANTLKSQVIVVTGALLLVLLTLVLRTTKQKQKLRHYAHSLKMATEAKSQFLARMSHEIRTPISAIIGLTKVTQKTELTSQQSKLLSQIEQSSNLLLGVVNDILDVSKIEAGKMQIEHAPFAIETLIERVVAIHHVNAHEKGLSIVQYIANDVPKTVIGDVFRIEQVLHNLLNNAIKFTASGEITLTVNKGYAEQHVQLEFAVKDTGIGLAKENIDRLFSAFSQADESITRRYGGTGLGLSICQSLVDLMGGRIWVESELNQGATFYFTVMVERSDVNVSNTVTPSPAPVSAAVTQVPDLSGYHILLVEDDEMNIKVAKFFLQDTQAKVSVVRNGQEAVNKLRITNDIDLVLMDMQMPVMDGLTAVQKIREELNLTLPIIAMTAHVMQADIDKTLAADMNAHITKPIDTDILYQTLSDQLADVNPSAATAFIHLNRDKAMKVLKGDDALYEYMVKNLCEMLNGLAHLSSLVEQRNVEGVRAELHNFRSALAYAGAYQLDDVATQLENTLKQAPEPQLNEKLWLDIRLFVEQLDALKRSTLMP